ncbi:pyridoxal phosphate-dependent aminotransferase [Sphaerisporangium corydalis]|uniref:Aminotransferase class I/II-fold pyridoxal phosphate-dependent enzyme n=1 Tax=Sphaerisporangium corydalis TaxID=1441875 RepID=A0ABV9EBB6_9ACTN|nr:aminotransferase class I/II-fold pyridoxal phosphate-dependent enzyme [Sphaerisporangium corydalis]
MDFCIPCNPYFPTPEVFELLGRNITTILKYYPSDTDTIAAELSAVLGLKSQTVVMGNGSTELITWIDHLLVRESLAIPIPTFGRWTDQPLETGKRVDMFPLPEAQGFALDIEEYVRFVRKRGSRVAVICNPNNPDGGYLRRAQVIDLLDEFSDLDLVVVDESFIDFVDAEENPSIADEAAIRPNVIVLKSLGKNFGLHGIRFGYMVANPALAGNVRRMLPKWNLNSFAESVVFMLKEHTREYQESLRLLAADRRSMFQQLATLPGLTVYPSQGNFLMVKLPHGKDGKALRDYLYTAHNVFVRECGNKLGSSSQFLRLVVRPRPDVQRLVDGLQSYLFTVGSGRAAAAISPLPVRQAAVAYQAAPVPLPEPSYAASATPLEPAYLPPAPEPAYQAAARQEPAYQAAALPEPAYQPPVRQEPVYQVPEPSYQPLEPAYQPAVRQETVYQPPEPSYQVPVRQETVYQPPEPSYQVPEPSYQAPVRQETVYQPPEPSYQAPVRQETVYQPPEPSYQAPARPEPSYPASSGHRKDSSYATPVAYSAQEPNAYLSDPAPVTPTAYLKEPAPVTPTAYLKEPVAAVSSYPDDGTYLKERDSYEARMARQNKAAGTPSGYHSGFPAESSTQQRQLPPARPYQREDPFVVGNQDPRHGRLDVGNDNLRHDPLDPLDTTQQWTFDDNTEPFSVVSPERNRRYGNRRP